MVATLHIKCKLFAVTLSQFRFTIKPLSSLDGEISSGFKLEKDILWVPVCNSSTLIGALKANIF